MLCNDGAAVAAALEVADGGAAIGHPAIVVRRRDPEAVLAGFFDASSRLVASLWQIS